MPDITILYTGDLHGKLNLNAAERIKAEKADCDNCLLLDAGDAVSSGNIYWRPGGEPILARMSEIGYDMMALGNREFHFLQYGFKSKVSLAQFPILSANLKCNSDSTAPMIIPSITLNLAGLRVAVFGLTVPMITPQMLVRFISPYCFECPIKTAAEIVPVLRESANIVIALTHVGIEIDKEIASKIKGVDLIVGGHTHIAPAEPITVGNTKIVHSGWWGQYLGKIELRMKRDGIEVSNTLINLRT